MATPFHNQSTTLASKNVAAIIARQKRGGAKMREEPEPVVAPARAAKKIARKKRALPERLRVRITNADLANAICGSAMHCAGANAIHRQIPEASYVKVNVNRVTITLDGILHHYEPPNNLLKVVAQNDDGSLTLAQGEDRWVTLKLTARRKAYVDLTPERRAGIRKSEADRKAAGTLKHYSRNLREEAARKAGRLRKRLMATKP